MAALCYPPSRGAALATSTGRPPASTGRAPGALSASRSLISASVSVPSRARWPSWRLEVGSSFTQAVTDQPPPAESSLAGGVGAQEPEVTARNVGLAVLTAAERGDASAERGRGERVGARSNNGARNASVAEPRQFLAQFDCAYADQRALLRHDPRPDRCVRGCRRLLALTSRPDQARAASASPRRWRTHRHRGHQQRTTAPLPKRTHDRA